MAVVPVYIPSAHHVHHLDGRTVYAVRVISAKMAQPTLARDRPGISCFSPSTPVQLHQRSAQLLEVRFFLLPLLRRLLLLCRLPLLGRRRGERGEYNVDHRHAHHSGLITDVYPPRRMYTSHTFICINIPTRIASHNETRKGWKIPKAASMNPLSVSSEGRLPQESEHAPFQTAFGPQACNIWPSCGPTLCDWVRPHPGLCDGHSCCRCGHVHQKPHLCQQECRAARKGKRSLRICRRRNMRGSGAHGDGKGRRMACCSVLQRACAYIW